MIAWEMTCLDSDGHDIRVVGNYCVINEPKDIIVEDHVWICPNVSLLKGSKIGSNCIVATNSVITKSFDETNLLIGSNIVLKSGIDWND